MRKWGYGYSISPSMIDIPKKHYSKYINKKGFIKRWMPKQLILGLMMDGPAQRVVCSFDWIENLPLSLLPFIALVLQSWSRLLYLCTELRINLFVNLLRKLRFSLCIKRLTFTSRSMWSTSFSNYLSSLRLAEHELFAFPLNPVSSIKYPSSALCIFLSESFRYWNKSEILSPLSQASFSLSSRVYLHGRHTNSLHKHFPYPIFRAVFLHLWVGSPSSSANPSECSACAKRAHFIRRISAEAYVIFAVFL